MKKITISFLSALMFTCAYPQNASETEIRTAENEIKEAFLNKDTITLLKYYSPNLVVNSPWNRVSTVQDIIGNLRKGVDDRQSFEKTIEKITFTENIAIVMGVEIIQPTGMAPNAGKTVKRRYTNIWMTNNNRWQLVARQSTVYSIE